MRRAIFLVVLMVIPAGAEAPSVADFVAANREAWLSKKKPGSGAAIDAQGRMAIGLDGDLLSAWIAATNPVAAAGGERQKLLEAIRGLKKWAADRRAPADKLAADAEALLASAGAVPSSVEGEDELSTAARTFAAAKGKSIAEASAAWAGTLRRWRSLDAWLSLTLRWVEEDCDHALKYEEAHRATLPADSSILFLSGGEHLMRCKTDIASLQRLAEDILKCDPAERVALRTAPHALPPSIEEDWGKLLKACDDPKLTALLENALDDRWNNAVVAHQVWKYAKAGSMARLAKVLKAWREKGGTEVNGLLEVMQYRQGSVFCAPDAGDRFQDELLGFQAPPGRAEAFAAAQDAVTKWVDGWSYLHQDTLADCFTNKKYDCFNVGSLFADLLANQGHDGIYPVLKIGSARHIQTAMRLGDRVEVRDGAGPIVLEWPRELLGDAGTSIGTMWKRTVDSWVDADILDTGAGTMTRRYLPYYGVDEEQTTAVKR